MCAGMCTSPTAFQFPYMMTLSVNITDESLLT